MKTITDTKKIEVTAQAMAIGEQVGDTRRSERLAGVNHSVIHIPQQLKGIPLLTLVHAVCTRVVSSVNCAPPHKLVAEILVWMELGAALTFGKVAAAPRQQRVRLLRCTAGILERISSGVDEMKTLMRVT